MKMPDFFSNLRFLRHHSLTDLPLHLSKRTSQQDFITEMSKSKCSRTRLLVHIMEEIVAPGSEVVTLDVSEKWTCARTLIGTCRVIKFFLEELKPVNTSDVEPSDCKCDFCTEDFTSDSHRARKVPCNHIFGKTCIE